ncbi:MAG: insulinase family protein [Muribaculaceae bacterium]|nr:insulinase family protein [Muribaculaceae bacterium]
MKKLFPAISLLLFILCQRGVYAQTGMTPIPLNPKIKTGVLSNGLTYYILHNEEPKERANFYIAQKVGSTLEEPDQLGLAHFLEHMAFNGTTNYPGKKMLDYLQSKGIRFGSDINAYTSFDETVYNINNVPTTDKNLMDSVLLVLHDWSGDILLEDSEIEAERGVIQEEWRVRNNANTRMYTNILPQIYKEYQYQQMPIGKMEVVMHFKPEVLKAYYKKWYRPDQQGIIIVGDFDADEMERKVKDLFSTIEMPANAAERTYPTVSDNEAPIYVTYSDPELTNMLTMISFKSEKIPVEQRNTVEVYVQNDMMELILSSLINIRLSEYALSPDCNYAYAGVSFGDFYVSKTKESFDVTILAKNDSQKAVADAMGVVARACKTGFTESEYDRVKSELLSRLDKELAEKDKKNNGALANEICRLFIDNEPAPGIEMEHQLWNMVLPTIPLTIVNQVAETLLTDRNMVVVTSAPQGSGFVLADEQTMLSTINEAMHAEYDAIEDERITEPLIAELPDSGKIISKTEKNPLGATVLNLSNGVKVVLKATDFAGDEILMRAYREGGLQVYDESQAANVLMMEDAFASSKLGPFDNKTLSKYLAGKNVSLSFNISQMFDQLQGYSTAKDLPYLFELIYAAFTDLNPDEVTYKANVERSRPIIANSDKNPQAIFSKTVNKIEYDNNPLVKSPTEETLDNAVYSESLDLIKGVLSDASQYTFIFVGNIDLATIEPLIEQYLASLPSKNEPSPPIVTPINISKGILNESFTYPMETPSTMVIDIYTQQDVPVSAKNGIMTEILGDILANIYIETLREEEGGTYSPYAGARLNPYNGEWQLTYLFFTNSDQQETLIKRAEDEMNNLLANGANESDFNKVKEAMIKQYEINSRKNIYWDSQLTLQMRLPEIDLMSGYEEALRNLDIDDFNDFIKNLYDGKNRIQVVMEGIATE